MKEQLDIIVDELLNALVPLEMAIEQFERRYIDAAIRKYRNNKRQAAVFLGVHRNTLLNKRRRFAMKVRKAAR